MPASKHTKKADTPTKAREWQHVRDSEIARGKSAGDADRFANGVLKKQSK